MVTALKQTAIVEEGGRIEIRNTQFRPGSRVEVIVLEEQPAEDADAAWERIIADTRPRPKLDAFAAAAIAEGGVEPLDLDRM
jgi:hypothetical protein